MNKEIIKPIAVAAFIGTVLIGSLTFYDFYMTKVQAQPSWKTEESA